MRKNEKMFKRIAPLFVLALLLFANSLVVFAADAPDPADNDKEKNKTGSIEIELTEGAKGTSRENVIFGYTKIAELKGGEYYLLDTYKASGVDLNTIERAIDLDEAAKIIETYKKQVDGTVTTDSQGKAIIKDLEIGVYLLNVENKAKYEDVSPALIAIPTFDEEERQMVYDLTIYPKHNPSPGTIITTTPPHGPKTGDVAKTNTWMHTALTYSGIIMMSILFCKRRNKDEKK